MEKFEGFFKPSVCCSWGFISQEKIQIFFRCTLVSGPESQKKNTYIYKGEAHIRFSLQNPLICLLPTHLLPHLQLPKLPTSTSAIHCATFSSAFSHTARPFLLHQFFANVPLPALITYNSACLPPSIPCGLTFPPIKPFSINVLCLMSKTFRCHKPAETVRARFDFIIYGLGFYNWYYYLRWMYV